MRTLVAALLITAAAASAQSPLAARLDSTMRAAEGRGFSGVVRVERDGALLIERGYGLANRERKIPFTPETVVQIGSNTKDFTAVAILRLARAGRLSLGDSLAAYFPDAPADKRGITLRQLLRHRAGFPLGIGGDFEPVGRDAFVAGALATPLLFAPGARQSYSNVGYALLAAVIERVTGRPYDEHVRDDVLAPLGLRRTGYHLPGFRAEELAHGYLAGGGDQGTTLTKPHAPDGPWWNLRGNGGMLSTVGDMHRFYAALFASDTLLPRGPERDGMYSPDEPIGLAGSDGVHFFLYERDPLSRTEIIVASTNAAVKAPAIRRELATVLGLPLDVGGDERVAARPGGTPAAPAVDALIRGFVSAVNANDRAALRRYVSDHFTSGGDAPSLDERMERLGTLHERLGAFTIDRVERFPDGTVEAHVRTGDGPGVFRFDVTDEPRIARLRVMMGG